MATLQELLDEQARIKNELQRMESDETVTEEADGDLRDTLLSRWDELDEKTKPLIARMEKIRAITRVAQDEANLERPDGDTGGIVASGNGRHGPDLVTSRFRNPYEDLEAVRGHMVRTQGFGDVATHLFDGVGAHARGIGTHVGNQTDIAIRAADVIDDLWSAVAVGNVNDLAAIVWRATEPLGKDYAPRAVRRRSRGHLRL
jgi:hypothetical protein